MPLEDVKLKRGLEKSDAEADVPCFGTSFAAKRHICVMYLNIYELIHF